MSAHARLSPSSASGWMICADYPNVQAQYPNTGSIAASEGTAAHGISDFCLTHGFDAYDMVGVISRIDGHVFEWTEDDADLLQPGIDWIREQPGTFYGEARLDLSEWLGDGQFGTVDRFIVSDEALICGDLKWGRGIPVPAVGNKQTRIYALGGWKAYAPHITDPDFPVIINIDQPRNAAGGGIWKITLGELWAFGEEVKVAAAQTMLPNPPRTASKDACLWCAGKNDCATYDAFNLSFLGMDDFSDLDDLEDLDLPHPETLTPARRRVILDHRQMIVKWLDGVHSTVYRAAASGGDTAGLKLVAGRKSADKWKDPKAAEKAIVSHLGRDKSFTFKLIGPAKAGKSISPEDWNPIFAEHVIVGARKPTLVDEADERPAIEAVTDASDFEDLDD